MSKIIIKKGESTFKEKNGSIIPIFEIEKKEYLRIEPNDFPSIGTIFVSAGFNEFEKDTFYEFDSEKLKVNDNYERDLAAYSKGELPKSPSKYILSYYHSNIKKTLPHNLIPIYPNRFTLNSNILIEKEGIESDIFFLKTSDSLFGPFQRDGNVLIKAASFINLEGDIEDDAFLEFTESYRQYDGSVVFEFSQNISSDFIVKDNNGNEFLVGFSDFIKNGIGSKIDFTPIPILHKWAIAKLTNSDTKLANILSELKNIQSSNNDKIDNLKWNKYISIIDEILENQENIDELVKILNEKNFIKETIDTTEIEKINKKVEDLKKALESKENANLTLINANRTLQDELKEEKDKVKENSKIDAIRFPNLSKVLDIENEVNEIEKILTEKITSSKLKKENDILEGEKRVLERDIKQREEEVRGVKDSVKKIKEIFDRTASEHTAKLQEAKTYNDLLNGIEFLPNKDANNDSKIIKANIISLNPDFTAKLYILEIKERLSSQGREISFNDVANLVITINQTFITIIAGAPGVGKTSLVEKLSKSYGLNEDFGYLEIACAKGWNSSKDLIGFFNPLTNKFQPAKTKLREALKKSEENPNAPYLVLLDEANLSPIEHYWSDFIKLADTNYSRKIKISDNEEIQFGDGFRFVATINHDHTTEALSNRLIDRAAIIQLDKPKEIKDDSIINIDSIFNFTEIQTLFKEPTKKWQTVKELIEDTFTKIKEILESDHTIIISPRKEIAVYKYCKVATGLLEVDSNSNSDDGSYIALDYAISQHILPLINGRGGDFMKLLEDLKKVLNDKGMIKSVNLLNKIIKRGKDLKHFRYIYY
ncbi:hypothetical protein IA01_03970 [Flavobacterium psychrophilum]|uniref:AAA+ ATPase domain-containing protein n=7 Tax=Flavobacterium psychrophilum TaxID=96345 RepID=A6GXX5_FLAPJ|nr:AAA family ATPase [Flavobacterium psychrophilum]AIG29678.1 hypothetical protein IA03_03955 [Flavobacterium psychrophilum]AIG31955.1 hypothetical protein IA01_03970 [Flavobacterium psychrophilum]AIG34110.1 hypothetical protein IA02_03370 [Flavobacterium psychrophilum]AIG36473.1 hypothetical protein IA04_03870 [Flavobacterium psychrophilum]AIG38738.1 hypothetical protein IA05_03955 [Flavobacterium psychrophilum]